MIYMSSPTFVLLPTLRTDIAEFWIMIMFRMILPLDILARMALKHAEAGADMVAPSDMMDGRVLAIRNKLDEHHFENTALMSYATKFASAHIMALSGKQRIRLPEKATVNRIKWTFATRAEAVREAKIDETEGADIVMVKPALAYLDIIRAVRRNTTLPAACYNVSAEYTMVKTAAKMGFIDEQRIVMENMYAFAKSRRWYYHYLSCP